jgi:YD repeat-containing protein
VSKSIRTGNANGTTYPDNLTDSITINLNVDQFLDMTLTLTSCCGNQSRCYIKNVANGDVVNPASGTSKIWLDSGQYRIIMVASHSEPTQSDERVIVSATYKSQTATTAVATGGGLRLKKMTTYDGISHDRDIIKTYTYQFKGDTVASSGYLANRPNYRYSFTSMRSSKGTTDLFRWPCDVWIRTSAAGNEIESAEGSVIYRTVLETDNLNGSTRYVYEFMDNSSGVGSYPFGPSSNVYPEKGSLKEQYTYNSAGLLLTSTVNTYATFTKGQIDGWKAAYSKKDDIYSIYSVEQFVNNYYTYYSNGALLSSSVKTDYSGTDSLVTETDYVYDNMNHILPTRIHNTNSQGDDIWTYRKYPTDFSIPTGSLSTGAQALKQMQDSNLHNIPLEQFKQQVRQGVTTTLDAKYVRYKVLPASSATMMVMDTAFRLKTAVPLSGFVPATVQSGNVKIDSNYEPSISFTKYDSTGNILEQQAVYGINEVYIWGYNNLYPVAKVVGTSYDTAISYVNKNMLRNPTDDTQLRTELDKIRTGLANSNVLVSTYTYKPQVGITSETDPTGKTTYYEYDNLGRLKVIRDMNGKILKQFSYQYLQPITQYQ